MSNKSFRMDTINKKFMIPTLLLVVILLLSLGVILVMNHYSSTKSLMESKASSLAALLREISVPFLNNYDFRPLEGFVQEACKDPAIAFVIYYDEQNNPVTTSVKEPSDISSLILYKHEVKNSNGKVVGFLRLGYKKNLLSETLYGGILRISLSILIAMSIMAIACIFIARNICQSLNSILKGLNEGIEQVVSASAQVSSASQSLAEGASEQAAGIQETSSSIEEMASMTKKNAESANQANNLMMQTSQVVDEANNAMKELINSMNEISTTSEETAKIIKTIDEIAFQTNLLALNAAVEAARAGEAGAGFAVVADEVRNLAMRAAEAAKNTASLIEESVKKIKNGSQIVSKTNEAFEKVAVSSKKVAELMAEIAAASQEQSQGIEQINKAVAEMDKVVQKNAASAEESASAAEEMNAQAETMKGFVEELTALVGRRDGNGWVGAKEAVGQRFEVKKIGGNGGKHLEKVVSKVGGLAKAKKDNGKFANKEAVPSQVIPLEEGDFKEF